MAFYLILDQTGQIAQGIRLGKMISTDTLATITTAGYFDNANLNPNTLAPTDYIFTAYGLTSIANGIPSGSPSGFAILTPSITAGVITLVPATPSVVIPTVANHFAVFTDTHGIIGEDASTAINAGNIQAGLSGTAGFLASFPATALKGSLHVTAVANTGNTVTTISNAAMGQASIISIPDPGATTANFIVSASAGTQHITSGGLAVNAGILTSGIATGGQVGELTLFPTTASTGSLNILATPNSGNTATNITNASFGQATVLTIPDPGAPGTANFLLSNSAGKTQNVSGNITVASNPIVANKTVTATASALATAGHVTIWSPPSGTSQIAILDIKVFLSTGLSGGSGNRLLTLTDGSQVFNNAGITAALLGTPVFTLWGGTGNPLTASGEASLSTAGASVFLNYSGGTTDYATGSVIISVTYVQVTT